MNTLLEVLTISEIARCWRKHPLTVRRAIDARRKPLIGRKSPETIGGVWLISRESVVRRWGNPQT